MHNKKYSVEYHTDSDINLTNSVWGKLHRDILFLDSLDHDTNIDIRGCLIPVISDNMKESMIKIY